MNVTPAEFAKAWAYSVLSCARRPDKQSTAIDVFPSDLSASVGGEIGDKLEAPVAGGTKTAEFVEAWALASGRGYGGGLQRLGETTSADPDEQVQALGRRAPARDREVELQWQDGRRRHIERQRRAVEHTQAHGDVVARGLRNVYERVRDNVQDLRRLVTLVEQADARMAFAQLRCQRLDVECRDRSVATRRGRAHDRERQIRIRPCGAYGRTDRLAGHLLPVTGEHGGGDQQRPAAALLCGTGNVGIDCIEDQACGRHQPVDVVACLFREFRSVFRLLDVHVEIGSVRHGASLLSGALLQRLEWGWPVHLSRTCVSGPIGASCHSIETTRFRASAITAPTGSLLSRIADAASISVIDEASSR